MRTAEENLEVAKLVESELEHINAISERIKKLTEVKGYVGAFRIGIKLECNNKSVLIPDVDESTITFLLDKANADLILANTALDKLLNPVVEVTP